MIWPIWTNREIDARRGCWYQNILEHAALAQQSADEELHRRWRRGTCHLRAQVSGKTLFRERGCSIAQSTYAVTGPPGKGRCRRDKLRRREGVRAALTSRTPLAAAAGRAELEELTDRGRGSPPNLISANYIFSRPSADEWCAAP